MENFDFLQSFLFPYINLAIFLFLAIYFGRKPVKAALANRRESYLALLEKANKAKEEAESKHRELDARLKGLDAELQRMRNEVKAAADQEAQAILSSGAALAEHLKREAKRIADAEVTAAKEAIRAEILAEVRQKTAEELKRSLDDNRQHQIVKQSLAGLNSVGANS